MFSKLIILYNFEFFNSELKIQKKTVEGIIFPQLFLYLIFNSIIYFS